MKQYRKIVWAMMALLLAITLQLCAAGHTQALRFVYVWGAYEGSSSDGSPQRPYKTIGAALQAATEGDVIRVAQGPTVVYRERLQLHQPVSLVGGYDPMTWERDPSSTATVLDGTGEGPVIALGPWPLQHVQVSIEGFTIRNGAAIGGGGIWIRDASPLVRNNRIVGNEALEVGGGILVQGGSPLIQGNAIEGNTAYGTGGGGICLENAAATLEGNRITGNYATRGDGGGLLAQGGQLTLDRDQAIANTSARGGGLFLGSDIRAMIQNVVIALNSTAGEGSGVVLSAGQLELSNASVLNNQSSSAGSALTVLEGSANVTVTNSLFWGNEGRDILGRAAVAYCDVEQGTLPGVGNLSVDPELYSLQGFDFHLAPASPLIDAGSNHAGSLLDFEGHWRVYDGDGDGTPKVDIGADEVAPDLRGSQIQIPAAGSFTVPGGQVAFHIRLLNTGQMAATGVVLTVTLPASLTPIPGSLHADGGVASSAQDGVHWRGDLPLDLSLSIGFIASIDQDVLVDTVLAGHVEVNYGSNAERREEFIFIIHRERHGYLPLLSRP